MKARGTKYNIILTKAGTDFWVRIVCRHRPNKFITFGAVYPRHGTDHKLTCYRT